MAICVFLLMVILSTLAPTPVSPQPRRQSDWWNDLGKDWEVSNALQQRSPQYAAYRQISRQMSYYAPALHVGRIQTGDLRNPANYRPRDRTYGKNADFNPRDFKKGVFKKVPDDGEWVEAVKSDVEAGLAKCVGDNFKLPTIVEVMNDGSYTVETVHKQNPCAWNPCQMFQAFKISDCSKEEDFIARCDPRNSGPFQLDFVWTTGKNLDISAIAIDACTREVLGNGAGRDAISHNTKSGAYGAINPQNKKKRNNEDFGVETLNLKTLPDGSDCKDYVYAIMALIGGKKDIAELQNTGGRLEVSYGGVVVETFPIPQGALVNTRNHRRYLFGCFKCGLHGHFFLDTSVAMFDAKGTIGKARMAEKCRPLPS